MPPLEAEPFLRKLVAKHLHMISRGDWTCSCEKLCDDSDRHFGGVLPSGGRRLAYRNRDYPCV